MNTELESAKDQLWKFQLRREHAQLLKVIDTHKESFTVFAEEAKAAQECLKDQLAGLKSKLDKLADNHLKQAQEAREYRKDVEEKIAEVDKIKADLMALGVHINALESEGNNTKETAIPTKPTAASNTHTTAPTKNSTASLTRRTSLPPTPTANPKPAHNVANTGLRKSSPRPAHHHQDQAHPTNRHTPPPSYAPFPNPPLTQSPSDSLVAYFSTLDQLAPRLDPAKLTALAAMFITGLAEREAQQAVVRELERSGLCRVLGDRKVEMRCGWGEVGMVLRGVGLLGAGGAEEGEGEGEKEEGGEREGERVKGRRKKGNGGKEGKS